MRLSASRRKPVERTGRFGAWRRRPARDESLQSPFGKKKPPGAFASNRLIQFLFLVRLAGFEPTTPWFVAGHSIQCGEVMRVDRPRLRYWVALSGGRTGGRRIASRADQALTRV